MKSLWILALSLSFSLSAPAAPSQDGSAKQEVSAETQEFDPFAPNAEEVLRSFDKAYEEETGLSAFPAGRNLSPLFAAQSETGCRRESCAVFVDIDKATQTLTLYIDGIETDRWLVSTGVDGRNTPNFDKHPDGRIYQRYTSTKFPGGDYMGLGNMPYAVFISGGFAIHGTPQGNWKRLGRQASHGCIRIHPENARYFNDLVRQVGVQNVWIWVH